MQHVISFISPQIIEPFKPQAEELLRQRKQPLLQQDDRPCGLTTQKATPPGITTSSRGREMRVKVGRVMITSGGDK